MDEVKVTKDTLSHLADELARLTDSHQQMEDRLLELSALMYTLEVESGLNLYTSEEGL